jgi:DNA-binding PadR family transcriptional regulator
VIPVFPLDSSLTVCKTAPMKQEDMPTLSGKEHLILQMLIGAGEMYGLEMVKGSGGKLARGTVYVTLSRMEEKGYVESRLEERPADDAGPARRLYSAKGYGVTVLRAREAANAVWTAARLA